MSDIADKSDRAIIRPGLNFQFLLVGPALVVPAMLLQALKPGNFGPGFKFVQAGAKGCCGAVFVSERDGSIKPREFWRLEYFFARDKGEARVFEYDRWGWQFHARRLEELWQRRTT